MNISYSRRKFLKNTIGAGVIIAGSQMSCSDSAIINSYNPKGLPTTVLGNTGVTIPRIAFGLGSRFCSVQDQDESLAILTHALDNGLYYWDTAHTYSDQKSGVISEERIGHIVKHRRKEIFLSTKLRARNGDEAKAQLELSLKRLQTDHLDILKIHSVDSIKDVAEILKKGNVLDVITRYKEEGVTRFIGFSGHASAQALKALVDTGRFDSMIFALNHWLNYAEDRQGLIVPAALEKGMGVMLMKALRPRDTNTDLNPAELVRYALSLKGPHGVAVGMDSIKVVDSNLSVLRNFKPMTDDEKIRYASQLTPFFKHQNLAWMKKGYEDGNWT